MHISINAHLELLGKKVKDKVTGFEGVVVSVSFDLYGCIQAIVNPGVNKEGKIADSCWFDVSRLEVTSDAPVMERPQYEWTGQAIAEGKKGCSEKPAFGKV